MFFETDMQEFSVQTLKCPGCSRVYTVAGEHAAKLLPCSHTVCGHCFVKHSCPVCQRNNNPAGNSVIDLDLDLQSSANPTQSERCSVHNANLGLFCNDPTCQKQICRLCLQTEHKDHHVEELNTARERRYNDLMKQLESLRTELTDSKMQLEQLRTENGRQTNSCKEELESNRKEAIKYVNGKFDKLVAEINRQKLKVDDIVDEAVAKINENMVMADSVEETTSKSSNCKSLTDKLETVKNINVQSFLILANLDACQSYEYIKIQPRAMGNICGKLVGKDLETVSQDAVEKIFGSVAEKITIDLSQGGEFDEDCEESTASKTSQPPQSLVVNTPRPPTKDTPRIPTTGTFQPTMDTPRIPTTGIFQPTTDTPRIPTTGSLQPAKSNSQPLTTNSSQSLASHSCQPPAKKRRREGRRASDYYCQGKRQVQLVNFTITVKVK